MKCEYEDDTTLLCGGEIKLRHAATAYHYSEEDRIAGKKDPNADFLCCEEHFNDYMEYWNQMWADYYNTIKSGL